MHYDTPPLFFTNKNWFDNVERKIAFKILKSENVLYTLSYMLLYIVFVCEYLLYNHIISDDKYVNKWYDFRVGLTLHL